MEKVVGLGIEGWNLTVGTGSVLLRGVRERPLAPSVTAKCWHSTLLQPGSALLPLCLLLS